MSLQDDDIAKIANVVKAWKSEEEYQDIIGFSIFLVSIDFDKKRILMAIKVIGSKYS